MTTTMTTEAKMMKTTILTTESAMETIAIGDNNKDDKNFEGIDTDSENRQ